MSWGDGADCSDWEFATVGAFIHQHQHHANCFRRRGLERLFGHAGNGARFAGATAPPVLLASALPEAGSFAGAQSLLNANLQAAQDQVAQDQLAQDRVAQDQVAQELPVQVQTAPEKRFASGGGQLGASK